MKVACPQVFCLLLLHCLLFNARGLPLTTTSRAEHGRVDGRETRPVSKSIDGADLRENVASNASGAVPKGMALIVGTARKTVAPRTNKTRYTINDRLVHYAPKFLRAIDLDNSDPPDVPRKRLDLRRLGLRQRYVRRRHRIDATDGGDIGEAPEADDLLPSVKLTGNALFSEGIWSLLNMDKIGNTSGPSLKKYTRSKRIGKYGTPFGALLAETEPEEGVLHSNTRQNGINVRNRVISAADVEGPSLRNVYTRPDVPQLHNLQSTNEYGSPSLSHYVSSLRNLGDLISQNHVYPSRSASIGNFNSWKTNQRTLHGTPGRRHQSISITRQPPGNVIRNHQPFFNHLPRINPRNFSTMIRPLTMYNPSPMNNHHANYNPPSRYHQAMTVIPLKSFQIKDSLPVQNELYHIYQLKPDHNRDIGHRYHEQNIRPYKPAVKVGELSRQRAVRPVNNGTPSMASYHDAQQISVNIPQPTNAIYSHTSSESSRKSNSKKSKYFSRKSDSSRTYRVRDIITKLMNSKDPHLVGNIWNLLNRKREPSGLVGYPYSTTVTVKTPTPLASRRGFHDHTQQVLLDALNYKTTTAFPINEPLAAYWPMTNDYHGRTASNNNERPSKMDTVKPNVPYENQQRKTNAFSNGKRLGFSSHKTYKLTRSNSKITKNYPIISGTKVNVINNRFGPPLVKNGVMDIKKSGVHNRKLPQDSEILPRRTASGVVIVDSSPTTQDTETGLEVELEPTAAMSLHENSNIKLPLTKQKFKWNSEPSRSKEQHLSRPVGQSRKVYDINNNFMKANTVNPLTVRKTVSKPTTDRAMVSLQKSTMPLKTARLVINLKSGQNFKKLQPIRVVGKPLGMGFKDVTEISKKPVNGYKSERLEDISPVRFRKLYKKVNSGSKTTLNNLIRRSRSAYMPWQQNVNIATNTANIKALPSHNVRPYEASNSVNTGGLYQQPRRPPEHLRPAYGSSQQTQSRIVNSPVGTYGLVKTIGYDRYSGRPMYSNGHQQNRGGAERVDTWINIPGGEGRRYNQNYNYPRGGFVTTSAAPNTTTAVDPDYEPPEVEGAAETTTADPASTTVNSMPYVTGPDTMRSHQSQYMLNSVILPYPRGSRSYTTALPFIRQLPRYDAYRTSDHQNKYPQNYVASLTTAAPHNAYNLIRFGGRQMSTSYPMPVNYVRPSLHNRPYNHRNLGQSLNQEARVPMIPKHSYQIPYNVMQNTLPTYTQSIKRFYRTQSHKGANLVGAQVRDRQHTINSNRFLPHNSSQYVQITNQLRNVNSVIPANAMPNWLVLRAGVLSPQNDAKLSDGVNLHAQNTNFRTGLLNQQIPAPRKQYDNFSILPKAQPHFLRNNIRINTINQIPPHSSQPQLFSTHTNLPVYPLRNIGNYEASGQHAVNRPQNTIQNTISPFDLEPQGQYFLEQNYNYSKIIDSFPHHDTKLPTTYPIQQSSDNFVPPFHSLRSLQDSDGVSNWPVPPAHPVPLVSAPGHLFPHPAYPYYPPPPPQNYDA